MSIFFHAAVIATADTEEEVIPTLSPLTNVTVRSDGWTMSATILGSKDGGSYSRLNEYVDPGMSLTVRSRSWTSGLAETSTDRDLIVTSVLRNAYPVDTTIQETENGDDLDIVLTLSGQVYADDEIVSCDVLAGFFTDNGTGGTGGQNDAHSPSVINDSIIEYTEPQACWLHHDLQRVQASTFSPKLFVNHAYGRNGQPVRAVKFTITDQHGNSATATATTLSTDSWTATGLYANFFTASVSLASLTQSDVCTVDATIYPWVGDAYTISVSGETYPSQNLTVLKILNDKNSTFGTVYAYVDGIGAAPAVSTVADTAATTPFASISAAATAIQTYNNANFSRNNISGGIIRIPAATTITGFGADTLDTAVTNGVIPLVIEGVNKTTSVYISEATSINNDIPTTIKFRNLTFKKVSGNIIMFSGSNTLDRMIVAEDCDFDLNGNAIYNGWWNAMGREYFINCTGDKCGQGSVFGTSWNGITLALGCEFTSAVTFNAIACSDLTATLAIASTPSIGDPKGPCFAFNKLSSNSTTVPIHQLRGIDVGSRGAALVGNIYERYGSAGSAQSLHIFGDGDITAVENICILDNTVVGERSNLMYLDTGSTNYIKRGFVSGNVFNTINIKSDTFVTAPSGNRTGNWALRHGVDSGYNAYLKGCDNGTDDYDSISWMGELEWRGNVNGTDASPLDADWDDDQSLSGGAAGNGDYTPGASSDLPSLPAGFTRWSTDLLGNEVPIDGTAFVGGAQVATAPEVDVTAPVLTVLIVEATGETTAHAVVVTDTAEGVISMVNTTSATPPTEEQVEDGQNHLGAAAVFADDVTVDAIGEWSFDPTGLTENTTYYTYFVHRDVALNISTVAAAGSFTTDAAGVAPADFTITSEAEWLANVGSFASGDIIEIDGVIPQRLTLTGDFGPAGIVIRGADASAELAGGLELDKPVNDFTVQDLRISVQQEAVAPWWSPVTNYVLETVGTGACSDFVFQDCIFDGDLLPMKDGGWLTTNTGVSLRTATDFSFTRCTFQNMFAGPAFNGCSNWVVEDCEIVDRHTDGFVLSDLDDDCGPGIYRNNHHVGLGGGMRYHADGIQWQPNDASNTISGIEIYGNTFTPGTGPWCAQADPQLGYQVLTLTERPGVGSFAVDSTMHCQEIYLAPGNYTVTLPDASLGYQFFFRRVNNDVGSTAITFALASGDTYSGGATPILTTEGDYWGAIPTGINTWSDAPYGPNWLPYNILVTSDRTLSTLEQGQTVTIDATNNDITVTLPAGVTTTYRYAILRIDNSEHTVTLAKTGDDTILLDGVSRSSIDFPFGYSIDISAISGDWTATEDPIATQGFFGNDDDNAAYADTEIHGNILFSHTSVGVRLQVDALHDPALDNFRLYNNTILPWLSDDMNSDGVVGGYEGNSSGRGRDLYLPGDDSFGWNNFTTGNVVTAAGLLGTGASNDKVGLDIGSISGLIPTTNVGAETTLATYFNGSTRSAYRPNTRAEVISAALAKASGPLDGTYIGACGTTAANGYYNFDDGEPNPPTTAPVYESSDPADGSEAGADSTITITFSQFLTAGQGNELFTLRNVTDANDRETFNITTGVGSSGGTISVYANTVTIVPGADMPDGKSMSVRWAAGAVVGHYGAAIAVNTGDTILNFTANAALASDFTPVTVSATTPARMSKSGLTGHPATTGRKIIFACNLYRESTNSDTLARILMLDSANDFLVAHESSGQLRVQYGAASFRLPLGAPVSDPRETLIITCDLTQTSHLTALKVYRNGAKLTLDSGSNQIVTYAGFTAGTAKVDAPTTTYLFDGATYGANTFAGEVGFIYYHALEAGGTLPDLDDPAVLAHFDAEELVFTDGTSVTGGAPLLFMHGNAAVWNAGTNLGSGGNFTTPITGSITNA